MSSRTGRRWSRACGCIRRRCDGSENSSEGGQLGNFYKNSVNDGDQFNVVIENYAGA